MSTHTAIILAAGLGSRLQAPEGHKLLASIAGRPLLDYHLENFRHLGVSSLVIVTGFRHNALEEAVPNLPAARQFEIHFAHNPDFRSGNGLSVLAGAHKHFQLHDASPFWLTMSDHLFLPPLFEDLSARFFNEKPAHIQGALMVDYKLDTIFDMPDATKLDTSSRPLSIGKELLSFTAVDAGLFWCSPSFVDALKAEKNTRGDCSTSDAVQRLHRDDRFLFWDIGPARWQDVDTPEARQYAETLIQSHS